MTDAASVDPQRRARGRDLLAGGIARHVVYAGKRYRVDNLNMATATLQQCDTGIDYDLDLQRREVSSGPINRVALAYSLGADIHVTPSADRPASGKVLLRGTAGPAGRYSLDVTYTAATTGGRPLPDPAVDRFRFEFATPIELSGCPVDTNLLDGSGGPRPVVSALRALFEALNAAVDERLAPLPAAVPSLAAYDVTFPVPEHGIVLRLHIASATIGDALLEVPPGFTRVRVPNPDRKRE